MKRNVAMVVQQVAVACIMLFSIMAGGRYYAHAGSVGAIDGNVYRIQEFHLAITNPVEEWEMQDSSVKDELFNKINRAAQNLVDIYNPASDVIPERLRFAAYRMNEILSAETSIDRDLDPQVILLRFVELTLRNQVTVDTELLVKQKTAWNDHPAYRIDFTTDIGFKQKTVTIGYFIFLPDVQAVLAMTFVMEERNYDVYKLFFDEVLRRLVHGKQADQTVPSAQMTLMDMYLNARISS